MLFIILDIYNIFLCVFHTTTQKNGVPMSGDSHVHKDIPRLITLARCLFIDSARSASVASVASERACLTWTWIGFIITPSVHYGCCSLFVNVLSCRRSCSSSLWHATCEYLVCIYICIFASASCVVVPSCSYSRQSPPN